MSGGAPRWVWAALAALYLLLFPYHPGLRSPNELCRLHQTRALVEYHTLELNQALRDYGWVGDLSVMDGRYYPSKAPLLSFAAVPVYVALRALGGGGRHAVGEVELVYFARLFLTVLPTLALLVLLRRFLAAHVRPLTADVLTATYGLGSLAFSYSLLFMSHQPLAVLLFGGFYALWRCARGEWRERGYVLAGACAGAAVACEYTGALGVLGLVLFGAVSVWQVGGDTAARLERLARALGLALLGALPFVVALMAYHQAAFGHPLESGYKHLADAAYQPWHLGGFLGIRVPDPRALLLSFLSPLRGLLALSPFLLLGLVGLPTLWRARRELPQGRALFALTLALVLGYTYFTASFSYDSWGWTTGPRHLTGLVPFLLLPAGLLMDGRLRGAWQGLARGLCAASVLVTGLATFVNYVPDDVSAVLFGLAVPLLREGFLPPSALTLLGLPQPMAGLLLLALLLAVAAWLLASRDPGTLGAGALVLVLVVSLHALAARDTPQDEGARHFLESVWLAPPRR